MHVAREGVENFIQNILILTHEAKEILHTMDITTLFTRREYSQNGVIFYFLPLLQLKCFS